MASTCDVYNFIIHVHHIESCKSPAPCALQVPQYTTFEENVVVLACKTVIDDTSTGWVGLHTELQDNVLVAMDKLKE